MHKYVSILLLMLGFQMFAQEINPKNKTYTKVDLSKLPTQMISNPKFETEFYFSDKNSSDLTSIVPLSPKENITKYYSGVDLFQLDTSSNYEYYPAFYASPKYFDSVVKVDMAYADPGTYFVANYTSELSAEKNELKDLISLLIQSGVIVTYSHIEAEMVHKVVKSNKKFIEIKFNVIWHYCTSECFDPTYKFSVRIDRKKKLIQAVRH